MDIRLHDIILSNSVHIIITFHNCLVRYVGARNSHPVCQVFLYGLFMSHAHYLPQEPQTVRHSFSRREACGCFGSLVTRSLLKVRVYRLISSTIFHSRDFTCDLSVPCRFVGGKGRRKKCVRRSWSRQDFFFGENHERLSFWRESNASNNLKESQRYWRCLGELGERRDT